MLDKTRHEQILKNILKDIYTSTELEDKFALKGGTCLYLFYNLDRFSVDLDFNLIAEDFNDKKLNRIISEHLTIDDFRNKYFTWIFLGSYEKGQRKIKIEINKRNYPDKYTNRDFYGITIPTLSPECMFAHKLCAIADRKKLQNRDLYDAHFMFNKQFDISEEIIKIRTGKTLKEYFAYLVLFIEKKANPEHILDGLGELLNDAQKNHVKTTLVRNLLFDLKSRI
ncbi:nucleotidyl transferase AbiEii/AbiGii toxin family protein [Candidatus Daviesbacteria bacterium]|nr:nucleotidyl transferase AbiEii/AbiGii toxin family protein [Candidatus Daviesbacteria bacterium]